MTRILVVDDELRICRFLRRALEAEGYQVDVADSPGHALRLVSENEYALTLLDLLMPGMDGYEVLRRLIEVDRYRRVLVLSAVGDVDSRVRCLRMGAVDFLAKPFSIAELMERVKHRVAERSSAVAPRWLEVGRVKLDLQRRTLHAKGANTVLSQREFILLGHLMRHAGEVCTRVELLADVWGFSFDPGSNVVDVCVRRLRSKLEQEVIETVRNVGYSFVAG